MEVLPASEKSTDLEILKLRIEYWEKRLESTSTSSHSTTQLIYLVDGAVLALVYFMIEKMGATRSVIGLASFPMLVLAIINYLHSEFVRIQHHWTTNIDKRLLDLLGEKVIQRDQKRFRLSSSHKTAQIMHLIISLALLAAGILMLLYGCGLFPSVF